MSPAASLARLRPGVAIIACVLVLLFACSTENAPRPGASNGDGDSNQGHAGGDGSGDGDSTVKPGDGDHGDGDAQGGDGDDAGGKDEAETQTDAPPGPPPDFGPNVLIFDPSMSMDDIQGRLNQLKDQQVPNHFGEERYAYFFKPGAYNLDVELGFFVQVVGLGKTPDDVTITGAVRSKGDFLGDNNATQNFWRATENVAVVPTEDNGINVWAVSQGTSFRRMHVKGAMVLSDGGWSSGGFIADSMFDDHVDSGTQQQFLLRNNKLGGFQGGSWNQVFVGCDDAPETNWPGSYTTIDKTALIREKPYLTIDDSGHYWVHVPKLKSESRGVSWQGQIDPETVLSTDHFYIAHSDKDDAASINAALDKGKHLLFTPGVYHLSEALHVTHHHTVVLGLGLTTLEPDNDNAVLEVDDLKGVVIASLLLDAGEQESKTLLQLGPDGANGDRAKDPVSLHDVHCRIGGAGPAQLDTCITVNANNVIGDNMWLWRADHGDGADWDANPAKHGMVVNGDSVVMYGLFAEHFEDYQTIWNGEKGRVFFYQSELPYDVPDQGSWQHDGVNGYASYKVADNVQEHEAWGLGAYCVFYNGVKEQRAFETPIGPGMQMHHVFTMWLGVDGNSEITHILNDDGDAARQGDQQHKTDY